MEQPELTTLARPSPVQWSSALLWAALALGLLLQLMYADWSVAQAGRVLAGGLILVFALHAYFIVGISKGRPSARWIYLLFFFGALALSPPNFQEFSGDPAVVSTETAQVVLQALAFLLLFTPKANAWFKRHVRAQGQ